MHSLITLKLTPEDCALEHVESLLQPFGIKVDSDYGVVMISPKRRLYVVRAEGEVDAAQLKILPEVVGVYGDPKIVPIEKQEDTGNGD